MDLGLFQRDSSTQLWLGGNSQIYFLSTCSWLKEKMDINKLCNYMGFDINVRRWLRSEDHALFYVLLGLSPFENGNPTPPHLILNLSI